MKNKTMAKQKSDPDFFWGENSFNILSYTPNIDPENSVIKVLVCEDDEMVLKMVEFKLQKDGYEVHLAHDGKEAIDKIQAIRPDIIITDIMMPYLNGLEIVHKVRKDLGVVTPIIIVSSIGLEKTVLEAFQLGADDFITKPFSPNELSVRVKKLLMKSV